MPSKTIPGQIDLLDPDRDERKKARPDGLVHQVKEVRADRGSRIIIPRCGAILPKFRTFEALTGASVWSSDVTCQACREE